MKKILLLAIELILFYPFGVLNSQNYVPFPEENALWVVSEESPSFPFINLNCKYYIDGDTTINSLQYVKIYKSIRDLFTGDTTTQLHASMRQSAEEKLVYFIRHFWGDETEKIGYNFNVSVGQTVSLPAFYFNIPNYKDSLFTLLEITNKLLENGEQRKQYHFKKGNYPYYYFIEGIGYLEHPIPNIAAYSQLYCFTFENVFLYGVEEECDFTIVDIEELDYSYNKSGLKISPNPANDEISIEKLSEHVGLVDIEIFNSVGKSIFELHDHDAQNSISVNTSAFMDGIYLLRISNKSTFIQSSKFIIKH